MRTRLLASLVLFMCAVITVLALDDYPRYPNLKSVDVASMTDSISCSRLARHIMRLNKKSESSLRDADVILVVVRSTFNNPLDSSYDSTGELKEDVEGCLNIAGSNGHVYVYQIDDDLKVEQIFHSGFEWTDSLDNL